MARTKKQPVPGKGYAFMERPDILKAADAMNFNAMVAAVEADPSCVEDTDDYWKNALHILVIGGSFRTSRMIQWLVENTKINCHQRDMEGRDPLALALRLTDEWAAELIAPKWFEESREIQRAQERAHLRLVDPNTPGL